MDSVLLARWQFALTSSYHFLFVPLTLGLSLIVAFLETRWVQTGEEKFRTMTRFWGGLFVINFAMGVMTGIVQEFHFGMNWSEYSRFVGDIFGAPLAIEALSAFFLESVFLGLWIFGWDKLSPRLHLLSIWVVALAGNISAFWILVANSFMQEPVGFVVRNGRAEMTDFAALLANPHVWYQFPHTVAAGLVTGAVFVAAVSAYHYLRQREAEHFRASMRISLGLGIISLLLVMGVGHVHGQHLGKTQPMKMAAANALWEGQARAPFNLMAMINQAENRNDFALAVPGVESFMMSNDFNAWVEGINEVQNEMEQRFGPGNYIPPVAIVFTSFRIMLAIGGWLLLLFLVAAYYEWRGILISKTNMLKIMQYSWPLPFAANIAGWAMAETGRQPWLVYGLQRVEHGISQAVAPSEIVFTMVGFVLIYSLLIVITAALMLRMIKRGPESLPLHGEDQEGGYGA